MSHTRILTNSIFFLLLGYLLHKNYDTISHIHLMDILICSYFFMVEISFMPLLLEIIIGRLLETIKRFKEKDFFFRFIFLMAKFMLNTLWSN